MKIVKYLSEIVGEDSILGEVPRWFYWTLNIVIWGLILSLLGVLLDIIK